MALAKVDDKKDVVQQMKKDIFLKYELTIGDLRGDAQKQLMSKSKVDLYSPKRSSKIITNFVTQITYIVVE